MLRLAAQHAVVPDAYTPTAGTASRQLASRLTRHYATAAACLSMSVQGAPALLLPLLGVRPPLPPPPLPPGGALCCATPPAGWHVL